MNSFGMIIVDGPFCIANLLGPSFPSYRTLLYLATRGISIRQALSLSMEFLKTLDFKEGRKKNMKREE